MTGSTAIVPVIGMLAALILLVFGIRRAAHRLTRTKGILMVVMAAVLIGNVAILTM